MHWVPLIATIEHRVENPVPAIVQSFLMRPYSHSFPSDHGTLDQESKVRLPNVNSFSIKVF